MVVEFCIMTVIINTFYIAKSQTVFSCRRSRADLVVSFTVHVLVLEPLPLLSEQSLFWLFRLSGDFSLGGTISFGALYPLGHFTLWGPLTLGAFCPQGHFALHDLLLFGSFFSQGPFAFRGYQGSSTFWVIQIFGNFWILFLLPAAGTEGSSVLFLKKSMFIVLIRYSSENTFLSIPYARQSRPLSIRGRPPNISS